MDIKELKNVKKVKCTNSKVQWFTKGKEYEIIGHAFIIKDDQGDDLLFRTFKNSRCNFIPIHETSSTTPPYYQATIQPIDLINAQNLNFNLGNVVKYVCRAGKKDGETTIKDLNKAIDYINFEIERLNNE